MAAPKPTEAPANRNFTAKLTLADTVEVAACLRERAEQLEAFAKDVEAGNGFAPRHEAGQRAARIRRILATDF